MNKDDYYLGVHPSKASSPEISTGPLFNIMSGDPSRGTISLETDKAPIPGTMVQVSSTLAPACTEADITKIYRRPLGIQSRVCVRRGLNFCIANSEGVELDLPKIGATDDVIELDDTFIAASENGLVISRKTGESQCEETWKTTLPGGSAEINWT